MLGHYQTNFQQFVDFIQPLIATTKSSIHQIIDDRAKTCISCSQRIFLLEIVVLIL